MISCLHQQLFIIPRFIDKGRQEHRFTEQSVSHLNPLLEGINIQGGIWATENIIYVLLPNSSMMAFSLPRSRRSFVLNKDTELKN